MSIGQERYANKGLVESTPRRVALWLFPLAHSPLFENGFL